MAHNIVNGFCESGCKVPVKPAKQIEDLQHGGTGVAVETAAELAKALGLMPVYTGPSDIYVDPGATDEQVATGGYFRTFQEALDVLSYKAILPDVAVHLAAGMAETGTWKLEGTQINADYLKIHGEENDRANLTGSLEIKGCHGIVSFGYLNMTIPTNQQGIIAKGSDICVEVAYSTFRGESTTKTYGVRAFYGARAVFMYCEFYDLKNALFMSDLSMSEVLLCKGNCDMYFGGAMAALIGTVPCSKTTLTYSNIGSTVAEANVTVDQGNP